MEAVAASAEAAEAVLEEEDPEAASEEDREASDRVPEDPIIDPLAGISADFGSGRDAIITAEDTTEAAEASSDF